MKEKLISHNDVRDMHPIFQGKFGDTFIDWSMKFSGLDNANAIYDRSKHLTGHAFCKDLLDKLEVKRIVRNGNILEKYKDEPFITVSNHPYGHVDGIALIETVASRVDSFKIMVNEFLGLIDTMAENFITVNPHQNDTMMEVTMKGFKECIRQLQNGHQLGFFPSGAVSNLDLRRAKFEIIDREWQSSIIKLIQHSKMPVIPIHISGKNSFGFYASKIFGWQFRSLMLCHDLYNKKGKEIILTVGEPISVQTMSKYEDIRVLGEFLKAETYALANSK